jgi:hypothetical protein
MPRYFVLLILTAICLFGCTIDDEDRCPDGLEWNADVQACQDPVVLPDAGADGGYLAPCNGHPDCASYEADYCMYDPFGDEPGICLFQDCHPTSCPQDSLCCDCSGLAMPVICIPEAIITGSALDTCDCAS